MSADNLLRPHFARKIRLLKFIDGSLHVIIIVWYNISDNSFNNEMDLNADLLPQIGPPILPDRDRMVVAERVDNNVIFESEDATNL